MHRFGRVGKGGTMARDLKPGDLIRTLGGTRPGKSVESVYNLEVARGLSFFVGKGGALGHAESRWFSRPGRLNHLYTSEHGWGWGRA